MRTVVRPLHVRRAKLDTGCRTIFWEQIVLEPPENAPSLWICASQTYLERLTYAAYLITPGDLSSVISVLRYLMYLSTHT